jgi:hypothetical protein
MDGKIKIYLDKRKDDYDQTYYIGKIKAPITIDCEKGVAFMIFISAEGEEELQICNLIKPVKENGPKVYRQVKGRKNNG